MPEIAPPNCLTSPEVQCDLATLHEWIKSIPAHHRPLGCTEVVIVSYYSDGGTILEGAYISTDGQDLNPAFDAIGTIETIARSIEHQRVLEAEWTRRTPEVLKAATDLAESLGDWNRGTMTDHLMVVSPNLESGLSPLAFLNDRRWHGDLQTLAVMILGLLRQAKPV